MKEILISGFGGQGIMSLGKIFSLISLKQGLCTTFFPSYGAEVRGGCAHCFVKIARTPPFSPFIKEADISIIMNEPSLLRFKHFFKKGSLLLLNSDFIKKRPVLKKNLKILSLPLNTLALSSSFPKGVNIVALGAVIFKMRGFFKEKIVKDVLRDFFPQEEIFKKNLTAFLKGKEAASKFS